MEHLEELRGRVLKSLLAVVIGAALCLVGVKPLVRLPGSASKGNSLPATRTWGVPFVSLKVAGYAGLTWPCPTLLFQLLAFVLPGLTVRNGA